MISNEILAEVVLENRRDFENLLQKILSEKNLEEKYLLAKQAVRFAVNNNTGYYSSDILEKFFLEVAQSHVCEGISDEYQQSSFLHVMTECYETGGHTRVVERWMEFGKEEQLHSLFFTEEAACISERLKNAVTGETYIMLDSMTDLEKGLELRKIASEYEFVILHIHMHDTVPLIAFGTKKFKRPVIFFNHADHRFWVGVSIADAIAELRMWGQELTLNKRGGCRSRILNVPPNPYPVSERNKFLAKQKLGFPTDGKILLTMGSINKYLPMEKYNFLDVIEKLLRKNEDVILIGIGLTFQKYPEWKKASEKLNGRILALGLKKSHELPDYIEAADCGIDSFPMSGGLALMEYISRNCPVVSLKCPTDQFDYVSKSSMFCADEEVLLQKVELILNDEVQALEFAKDQQKWLAHENNWETWKQNLNEVLEFAGKEHEIRDFKSVCAEKVSDLDMYLVLGRVKKIILIPFLFGLYRVRVDKKRRYRWLFAKNNRSHGGIEEVDND